MSVFIKKNRRAYHGFNHWVLKVLLFIVILRDVQIMVTLNIKIKKHDDCEVICWLDNLLRVFWRKFKQMCICIVLVCAIIYILVY